MKILLQVLYRGVMAVLEWAIPVFTRESPSTWTGFEKTHTMAATAPDKHRYS